MPAVRILVVDDSEQWRRTVSSIAQKHANWVVVAEASDGLEAVLKAETEQPDLVLLDLRLPTLSGIEAAKRIGEVAPRSKILVISQESSSDVVQEVLSCGPLGYVYKSRIQRELVLAIESVLAGGQFIGSGLKGYKLRESTQSEGPHRHDAVFYSNDTVCVDSLADFTVKALKAGKTAFVVATKPHREGFLQKVRADYSDVDIDAAIQQGTCVILDALETLLATTVNGVPDRGKLFENVGGLIELAAGRTQGGKHSVAACGECAPLFWAEGKKEAAVRLERLWDDLSKTHGIEVLCTYPLSGFQSEANEEGCKRMCAEHMAVYFE